jgi:hypothetical protein
VEIQILSSYSEITNSDNSPMYAVLIEQILTVPSSVAALSVAARLLELRIRIPTGAWTSVFCDCCVLSEFSITCRFLVQGGGGFLLCVCVCVVECDQVQQ